MAMQMQRAFNTRMMTKMDHYQITPGSYDDNNDWVGGSETKKPLVGVIKAGNKFSQFEEGQAIHNEDGGTRVSKFVSLYITARYIVKIGDKIFWKGEYYNILQQSDEEVFGFTSWILEKSKNWEPS